MNQEKKIGALRSYITLTLHSQYATRLWLGRPVVKEGDKIIKSPILSMPSCLSILSQIQKDAANDDPYADWYLIQFEDKVLYYIDEMKSIVERLIDLYEEKVPEGIDISRCSNISPVLYPIYVNSQLGYKLIYLLSEFDLLARSVMTASHIALMTRSEAREWLEAGAVYLRRCFGVVETYRSSGITRKDVAENNLHYQNAVKRFKLELPEDVLSGERRAIFAPIIKSSSLDVEFDKFDNVVSDES